MKTIKIGKKKTVVFEDEVEYATKGNVVAVRIVCNQNGKEKHRESFFVDKDVVEKRKRGELPSAATFMGIPEDDRFYYYDPEKFKAVEKCFAYGVQFYQELEDSLVKGDAIELMDRDDFDKKNVIRFKAYNHTFYRIGSELRISIPYHVGYIGGVTNGRFDLKKAKKILEKCKYVYNIEENDIPYYNADNMNNRAIEFSVKLPQKKHDELLKLVSSGEIKREHMSVKDMFAGFYMFEGCPDVLGLGKALLSEEERETRMGY
jgi:hypothetical protein